MRLHNKNYVTNQKILPQTLEEKIIMENIDKDPKHIDQIIKECNLTASVVSSTLSLMEMKGLIKNLGGQNYIALNI